MKAVDTFRGFAVLGIHMQLMRHMYSPYPEHLVVVLAHLTHHFSNDLPLGQCDLARCQRAGKSADQSGAGRGNQIVDGRGVGGELIWIDSVMLGNLAVHSKRDGIRLRRDGR